MNRERRWVVVAEDGRHATLGRLTDPSEDEILKAETDLVSLGVGGWLAVTEGAYYSDEALTIMEVRQLGSPVTDWERASALFIQYREAALHQQ